MNDYNKGIQKLLHNPNIYCFKCGQKNDPKNFAFTDIDETFHIICLDCKAKEWGINNIKDLIKID